MRSRFACPLLLACLPLALAACGDDDDDGGGGSPQVFEVEASEKGVTTLDSVEPGAVEIRFTNTGKKDHSAQIVRLDDGHTAEEGKAVGEAWGENGKPLPEWLTFHGGVGSLPGGESATAVAELEPGDYAIFDIEGEGEKSFAEFTVEGEEGEALPETDGKVEAREYSFTGSDLTAGRGQILFENVGEQPHHLIAAPIKPGKSIGDVRNFVKNESGEAPIDEEKTFVSAIVSGGTSAVIDVDLQSGDYALVCFIPDATGGPPHAVKGMVSAASVE
jgi:hypothetical protein